MTYLITFQRGPAKFFLKSGAGGGEWTADRAEAMEFDTREHATEVVNQAAITVASIEAE